MLGMLVYTLTNVDDITLRSEHTHISRDMIDSLFNVKFQNKYGQTEDFGCTEEGAGLREIKNKCM